MRQIYEEERNSTFICTLRQKSGDVIIGSAYAQFKSITIKYAQD
jgi:hypothetical protein